jgi:integrase/recombinase XerD
MSLAHELDRYLSVRRSLGADLRTDERILSRFVTFADNDGVTHTSTDLFLRWHATLAEAGSSARAARLSKQVEIMVVIAVPGMRDQAERA